MSTIVNLKKYFSDFDQYEKIKYIMKNSSSEMSYEINNMCINQGMCIIC